VSHYNPACATPARSACEAADGVLCTDTLDFLPDEDVPWMLEELFRRARHFVSVSVGAVPYERRLPNGTHLQGRVRPLPWWQTHLDATSRRYPKLRWHLRLEAPTDSGHADGDYAGGALGHEPIVWVLTSHKPGHTTQARGLADALGWPYTTKTLHFRGPTGLYKYLLGTDRATRRGLDISQSDVLGPPWPDLVIVAGWRPGRVARWIQHESHGRTHLVLLGRIGSRPVAPTDISIVCEHFRLPPHPRRIETGAPVTQVNPERLETAADTWRDQVEATPRPWIMLLVGGATARHELTSDQADRLGAEVRAFAERLHGTVFATTSRRTGHAAAEALAASLGPRHSVYAWRPDRADNPYLGYLALADLLIVTGESESMLAEAVATEKPVYIYPLAERSAGVLERTKDWILMRAQSQQRNKRGRPRPQRGLAYVCGRLIERGIVQPRRDLNALHVALIGRGSAAFFPDAGVSNNPLELRPRPALRELDRVTEQVRGLLPFRVQP
jgi:mitochondrial fission protein ELM1